MTRSTSLFTLTLYHRHNRKMAKCLKRNYYTIKYCFNNNFVICGHQVTMSQSKERSIFQIISFNSSWHSHTKTHRANVASTVAILLYVTHQLSVLRFHTLLGQEWVGATPPLSLGACMAVLGELYIVKRLKMAQQAKTCLYKTFNYCQ
jgi:hypothetical protein